MRPSRCCGLNAVVYSGGDFKRGGSVCGCTTRPASGKRGMHSQNLYACQPGLSSGLPSEIWGSTLFCAMAARSGQEILGEARAGLPLFRHKVRGRISPTLINLGLVMTLGTERAGLCCKILMHLLGLILKIRLRRLRSTLNKLPASTASKAKVLERRSQSNVDHKIRGRG